MSLNLKVHWKNILLATFAIAVGIIADWFFYLKATGIAFPIFVGLTLGVTYIVTYLFDKHFTKVQWLLLLPIVVFSIAPALRINNLTNGLAIGGTIFIGLLFFSQFSYKSLPLFGFLEYLSKPLWTCIDFLSAAEKRWRHTVQEARSGKVKLVPRIFSGILIAAPLLFLFALLFSSADAIFKQYIQNIFDGFSEHTLGHTFYIILGIFITFGALSLIFARELSSDAVSTEGEKGVYGGKQYFVESVVVLGLINALFLLFVFIQLRYLFGGVEILHLKDMTYAEYARRGFYELLVASGISFFLIYIIDRIVVHTAKLQQRAHQVLSSLLILQVFVLLISAIQRLSLYVEAFSLTRLRLYSYSIAAGLFVVFLLLLANLFFTRFRRYLLVSIFSVGCLFWAVTVLANGDGFIARTNIRLYQEGKLKVKALDTRYLARLSPDAWPEVFEFFDNANAEERASFAHEFDEARALSRRDLWQAWSLGGLRAKLLLQMHTAALQEGDRYWTERRGAELAARQAARSGGQSSVQSTPITRRMYTVYLVDGKSNGPLLNAYAQILRENGTVVKVWDRNEAISVMLDDGKYGLVVDSSGKRSEREFNVSATSGTPRLYFVF